VDSENARSRSDRYTRVAIALHWAIAAFIIFNLATGFFMESWPTPVRLFALQLHLSSGLTVLALTVARVVWRLVNPPPPYPAGMKPWERHTAHFAHFLLYAAMVLMPLTGWAILSAHPPPGSPGAAARAAASRPTPAAPRVGLKLGAAPPVAMSARPQGGGLMIWYVIPMPAITPIEAVGEQPGGLPPQHKLHEEFVSWHTVGGWLLLGLLFLHIAGALKHQMIDKHAEFARMGIGKSRTLDCQHRSAALAEWRQVMASGHNSPDLTAAKRRQVVVGLTAPAAALGCV
jgi:cytochrome b561